MDKLLVNGAATFNSSATVTGKDAATGYSLMLSSGINMPAGTVNAGLFTGSGLGLTGVDFLGANQTITGVKTFSSSVTVTAALGIGVLKTAYGANLELSPAAAAQYGGIYSSTHVYVNGNVYAAYYSGDGSGLTGANGADNLGNHIATTTLNMAGWNMVNVSSVNFKPGVFIASAPAAQYGGVYVSTNLYINGKLYGDASGLTGLSAAGDDLGNHTAAAALDLAGYQLANVSTITFSSDLDGGIVLAPYINATQNYAYTNGIAIGSNTYSNYSGGVGVGYMAFYNKNNGVGIGYWAHDNNDYGVGIGYMARNNSSYGVGIGYYAYSNDSFGVGIGSRAYFNQHSGVGLGANAYGNNNYGVGAGAYAYNNPYYAVGIGAYSHDNKTYGSAIGAYSYAATSSTALGSYAKANAEKSVAIGAGTINNSTGTADFGVYAVKTSSNINAGGDVYAAKYYGDGSALTGLDGLAIGDSYGGGIVFWVDAKGNQALISATADQSGSIKWSNDSTATGATLDGVYAGKADTVMISTMQGPGSYAARLCEDYSVTVGGEYYDDWYLPSKAELQLLYAQRTVVGGFVAGYYWSSTEYTFSHAWNLTFDSGVWNTYSKTNPYKVRCVRAGPSTSIGNLPRHAETFTGPQLTLSNNVVISTEASAALGGGVRVSSNVYIVGFSSAAKYYGDGSALTGITAETGSSISISTINATATTPYGGVNITTNVFITGGVRLAKYPVQAANTGITLTAADFGKTITVNSASDQTINLPSVTAADIGATITIIKLGAGRVTIDAPAGAYVLNSTSGGTVYNSAVSPPYAAITLRLVNSTLWLPVGVQGSWEPT
ncbi:MAG: DUF1566 domain-containing protein [Elusimicrobiales bacterium]